MNTPRDPAGRRLAPSADLVEFILGQMTIEAADGPDTKFSIRLPAVPELKRHIDLHYVHSAER